MPDYYKTLFKSLPPFIYIGHLLILGQQGSEQGRRIDRLALSSPMSWLVLDVTCDCLPHVVLRSHAQRCAEKRGYQLSNGKDWSVLDILAAAYAENGNFKLVPRVGNQGPRNGYDG